MSRFTPRLTSAPCRPGTPQAIRALRQLCALAVVALAAPAAHASFLSGDALFKAANVLAIVVIVVVPIVAIVVFWLVHVLPEKIAHKRHHPQTEAIQVLCLLSLVFGGLLWPIAWLWAYTKPVLYKMAYGRDKADSYYADRPGGEPVAAVPLRDDVARLRGELDALMARSQGAPAELEAVREQLASLERRLTGGAEEAR